MFCEEVKWAIITFLVITLSIMMALNSIEKENRSSGPRMNRTQMIILWSSPSSSATNNGSLVLNGFDDVRRGIFMSVGEVSDQSSSLEYDFYLESCPSAEKIVRHVVRGMYTVKPSVAPALLRLVFHDCFIEGCDASVLLDPDEGVESEKDSPPNKSLKGFDIIDIIKSELESVCPGVVSCSDILVLAAREAIVAAGGPFYPLNTGRKDSLIAFRDIATYELPSAHADLSGTLASFASRGFDERETVSLLGAHSIGMIHCKFFEDRLYDFYGSGQPDPSLDPELLKKLKTKCPQRSVSPSSARSPSSASSLLAYIGGTGKNASETMDREVDMSYRDESEAKGGFGTWYYRRLLQNKGLLFADQQLMAGEETGMWVRAYASDPVLFRRDFALAMMKLSNLYVLTGSSGQVRRNCSKVA